MALGNVLASRFRVLLGRLRFGRPGCWNFDSHLNKDLPVIWAEACAAAGKPPAVLGYSMGGMLALIAQARGIFKATSLILLATPVVFQRVPFYPLLMRTVLNFVGPLGLRRIPLRFAARLLVWFFAGGHPSRIDSGLRLFHALARTAGVDVPVATLAQAAAWVELGRFVDGSGKNDYLGELKKVTVPALFLAGSCDRIAPLSSVKPGFDSVSSTKRELVEIPAGTHLSLANGFPAVAVARRVSEWLAQD